MSVPRLFYCTVAGLVVAALLSFLFGASGLLHYSRLQEHERRLGFGIATLEQRHADLERLSNQLRTEPELLRLLAREAGYYRNDELVIRVGPQPAAPAGGASPYAPDFSDVGPLVQPRLPAPRDPFNVLALGLFLGVGMFAALTVKKALRRRTGQAGGADRTADVPDTVAGGVEDVAPRGAWRDSGRGLTDAPAASADNELAAQPPAAAHATGDTGDAADIGNAGSARSRQAARDQTAEPGSRKRRRVRRRRGEVTVYRL